MIVFVLGATSTQAHAEDSYQPQTLPACKVYVTAAGEVCGYLAIDDWKTVLRADAELVHRRTQQQLLVERTTLMDQQIAALREQFEAQTSSRAILIDHNAKLTKKILELDVKYQDERTKSGWGDPLAWTIAGVSTSILVGFLLSGLLH